ncbi:PIG-L deacetylase family protein [Rhodospirillaceae bacterium SYSU D60014]|uniref:PIG-L deacetylase family protein n=1 Tax=Virgifigura deserti TaxID=2268457 RepID=UPI0013C44E68
MQVPSAAIVAAHPDDEVIGAGGQLSRLRALTLLHVTDGAPRNMRDAAAGGFETRQAYARARRGELEQALALAGIAPQQTDRIGIADQEAAFHLAELALTLAERLDRICPDIVVTHPYEGGHPDHDSTAFAVHGACDLLKRRNGVSPAIVEMASYHMRDGTIAALEFLPNGDHDIVLLPLTDAQQCLKRRMIACFASQAAMLTRFPPDREPFRPAPTYDFRRPPHAGRLFYELFDWGMTGARWRALAGTALASLQSGRATCR